MSIQITTLLRFLGYLLFIPSVLLAQAPDVVINEFLASNQTIIQDDEFGQYSDWLELYNTTDAAIDVGGYYLSDNNDVPAKWQLPNPLILESESYLLVWADDEDTGLHANFKISRSGEMLVLSDPDTNMVDQVSFGPQQEDISLGRHPDSLATWMYFAPPSPGVTNDADASISFTPSPLFASTGGYYEGSVTLSFNNTADVSIYYTLDGTLPDDSATPYTTPVVITETTPVRAISYTDGNPPSPVKTETYLIDVDVNLPIISLVTDPANFFDDEIGIYVTGVNGTGGYCAGVVGNMNQDWERPINVELYDLTGDVGLNQQAGVKIFGGCSRHRFPQKSLALFARSVYGDGSFSYRLFEEKDIDSFESFVLRAGADDQIKTHFRDAAAQQLMVGAMETDYQAYQPAVVYLNGEYWGIHNIREKLNEHYFEDNFGVDPDDVNILAGSGSSWSIHHGSNVDYLALMDLVTSQDLSDEFYYGQVESMMDIHQYIQYMVGHIYQAESDWPGNNIKFWKANSGPYDRWRWLNFDMDGSINPDRSWVNMIHKCTTTTGPSWPNPEWSTRLFRNLLQNQEFRHQFIKSYAWHMNTTFSSSRIISVVDSLADRLRPEMPAHIDRWGGQVDPVGSAAESWITPTFASMDAWESNVNDMRIFAEERSAYTIQHMNNHFGLSGHSQMLVDLNIPNAGVLTIDDHQIPAGFSGGYFNDIPVTMNAIPMRGYRFSHWELQTNSIADLQVFDAGSQWKYHDYGANLGSGWRQNSFNDDPWSVGQAQFGYGDGDEETVVSYGGDASNKHITTYFRKTFSVNGTNDYHEYRLSLLVDDGAIVYLNGNEILRVNMPSGLIFHTTLATGPIADENTFQDFTVPASAFSEGLNILAVEVHQSSSTSSDISFDCSLTAFSNTTGEWSTVETPEIDLILTGDINISAFFETESNPEGDIVISEINYNAADDHDTGDWVELYNHSNVYFDLSQWRFIDGAAHTYVFPDATLLGPENFMILARDVDKFREHHPEVETVVGSFDFGLSSTGERLLLKNHDLVIMDEVEYGVDAPWPTNANGTGYTIELMDLSGDNALGEHWTADQLYGTPGHPFQWVASYDQASPLTFALAQNYPNPFNPATIIRYVVAEASDVKLSVYDVLGREVIVLENKIQPSGSYQIVWNGTNAQGVHVGAGLYFCRISAGRFHETIKMVYLR